MRDVCELDFKYLETNAGTFLMLHVFDALSSTLRYYTRTDISFAVANDHVNG